ncbi:MAG: hypothetical protein PHF46_02250 [Candidatus Gracilibacteria bacterium]|nr:hypothetical protein [Candidatus Gracilibacteria bacterium]MDD4530678.1 hypothetical protein [Candidatus Gracilibacteria bacterium]
MIDLEKYSKQELIEMLKVLKKYRNLRKNTGKKSAEILRQDIFGETRIKVEYFPSLNKGEITDFVIILFLKLFGKSVELKDIIWKENTSLTGGIRLYFGDDLLDITYADFKTKLK